MKYRSKSKWRSNNKVRACEEGLAHSDDRSRSGQSCRAFINLGYTVAGISHRAKCASFRGISELGIAQHSQLSLVEHDLIDLVQASISYRT